MKRSRNKLIILGSMIAAVLFLSIGFAAFSKELNISGFSAFVHINMDIYLTNFANYNLESDAESSGLEYTDTGLYANITLPNPDSKVTYLLEVTNMGNVEMGIYNINYLDDRLEYIIHDYKEGYDKICDDQDPYKCINGSAKTLYLTIQYKDGEYDGVNKSFDLNLDVNFQYFHKIFYVGINDTSKYPEEVMNEMPLSIQLPSDVTKLKITRNSVAMIKGSDYIWSGNHLTVNKVTGTIRIINIVDILKGFYVDSTFTKNGLTITSKEDGTFLLNGTTTSDCYIRLTDYLRIANRRDDLYNVYEYRAPYPINKIISAQDKVKLVVTPISGDTSDFGDDSLRVTLRQVTSSDLIDDVLYDFSSGYIYKNGSNDEVILSNDVGILSLYSVGEITFNSYQFKISLINPDTGESYVKYPQNEIDYAGVNIKSLGDGTFILNGTSNGRFFVRLSDYLVANTSRISLYEEKEKVKIEPVNPIFNAPNMISLVGKNYSGTMSATDDNQVRLTLRGVDDSAALSSYGYDFVTGVYGSGAIDKDVGMASLYIKGGVTFDNYSFAIHLYEEPKDYQSITRDGLEIRLYDDAKYIINGTKTSDGILFVNLESSSLKFANTLQTTGDHSVDDSKYDAGTIYLEFVPVYTDMVTFNEADFIRFQPMNFTRDVANLHSEPLIRFDATNQDYLRKKLTIGAIDTDAHAIIMVISGKPSFQDFSFYLNRGSVLR